MILLLSKLGAGEEIVLTASPEEKALSNLRQILTLPENRGRVISVSELAAKMRKSRVWFYKTVGLLTYAQVWLEINQDAPLDAKVHYKGMLDEALAKLNTDVKIKTPNNNKPKQFFVPKEQAVKRAKAVGMVIGRGEHKESKKIASLEETSQEIVAVEVSERDKIIASIRDAFTMAPLGETPNVRTVMQDLGLVDRAGAPTDLGRRHDLAEEKVRQVMVKEDWRGSRSSHLHRTLDLIPDEIKLINMVRHVDTHKMLYNEIKMIHRNNMMFYQTGKVASLDGKATLDYKPDPGQMATLAEVMRRMIDGGGNVNILINNGQINQGGTQVSGALSLISKKYIGKLDDMSPQELQEEIDRLDRLRDLLDSSEVVVPAADTGNVIDAEFSEELPAEDPPQE